MPSSVTYPKFALALCVLIAFAVPPLTAQSTSSAPRESPSAGQVQGPRGSTVAERLAADLTWTLAERDARFGHMDTVFPVHVVHRAGPVRRLSRGTPLPAALVQNYLHGEHLAGVLILHHGRILAEQYALGATSATRWTGFSMTKAVTDTLAGAAVHRGQIHSLDDDVTRYLPEMRGSAYEGVTVRQLMTMTSGVRWNENYTTPDADNVRLYTTPAATGQNSTIEYMRRLPRESAPGERWHYNTGETDLLGVLLRRATGRSLADQLSAAIWQHAGMQSDATWIALAPTPEGEEFGGSGLSSTLRDWGRLGIWVSEGGHGAVDADWFAQATTPQVQTGGAAYGYGWWPQPGGSYAALGIFGQSILVDPARHLVIVSVGDWPEASSPAHSAARKAFWLQVQAAVDNNR